MHFPWRCRHPGNAGLSPSGVQRRQTPSSNFAAAAAAACRGGRGLPAMGISGLHPAIKPYLAQAHVKQLAGHRVGIDASGWLHR